MISLSSLSQGTVGQAPTPQQDYSGMKWNDAVKAPTSTITSNPLSVASDIVRNAGNDYGQSIQPNVNAMKNDITGTGNPIVRGFSLAGHAVDTIFAPLTSTIKAIADKIGDNPEIQKIAQTRGVSSALDEISGVGQKYSDWAKANPNKATILEGTLKSALFGLGAGDTEDIPSTKDVVTSIANDIKGRLPDLSKVSEAPSEIPDVNSRIQDATPSYSKSMVGTKIKLPDTVDESGNVTKSGTGSRLTADAGRGKESPVVTSAQEHAAGTELKSVPNYPDKGTFLDKGLATDKEISAEGERMRAGLQAEDKANPLNPTVEKAKVTDIVKSNLPKDMQEIIGTITPEDQQFLAGIQEKAGLPQPPGGKFDIEGVGSKSYLPKTAMGKYTQQVLDALKNYDGTREGKLDLRQSVDSAYKTARGKLAFGSDSANEIDEANTDIRNGLNKDLADSTKNTDVQTSLKKQSNLYNARNVLDAKAMVESRTAFGRLEQKYPSLRMGLRSLQRQGFIVPLRILESVAGVTTLLAAARKLTQK